MAGHLCSCAAPAAASTPTSDPPVVVPSAPYTPMCLNQWQTERAWASKIIRGQVEAEQLPGLQDYLAAVKQRREGAGKTAAASTGSHTWA